MEESVAGRKGNGQTLRLPLRWGSVSSRLSTCAHGILFVGSKPPPTPGECDGRQQSQKFHENLNFFLWFSLKNEKRNWGLSDRFAGFPLCQFLNLFTFVNNRWVTGRSSQLTCHKMFTWLCKWVCKFVDKIERNVWNFHTNFHDHLRPVPRDGSSGEGQGGGGLICIFMAPWTHRFGWNGRMCQIGDN